MPKNTRNLEDLTNQVCRITLKSLGERSVSSWMCLHPLRYLDIVTESILGRDGISSTCYPAEMTKVNQVNLDTANVCMFTTQYDYQQIPTLPKDLLWPVWHLLSGLQNLELLPTRLATEGV